MIPTGVQIFIALEPVDMRLGFERLGGLVRERIGYEPRGGALFLFVGRRRETLKILFFDGTPNLQKLLPIKVGEDVPEQFQCDLEVEYAAIERLNAGIALAVAKGDNGTRELLASILVAEEEHADWLETQLETIRQIGVENYLAQKLG